MNKKRVNGWLMQAKEALEKTGIVQNGKVESSTYRSQISSFGATAIIGNLKSAVVLFATQGASQVERPKLLTAMYYVISGEMKDANEILEIVCKASNIKDLKQQFTDAAIALKMAMNFFDLNKESGSSDKS